MSIVQSVAFDEGTGDPIESVSGNPLVALSGGPVWEDLSGLAFGKIAFKMATDHIWTLPALGAFPSSAITLRVIRKMNGLTGAENGLCSLRLTGGGTQCWIRCPDQGASNHIRFGFGGDDQIVYTGYTPDTTNVERWAFTADGAGGKIYLNGPPVASTGSALGRSATAGTLEINRDNYSFDISDQSFLQLIVDDTRLDDAAIAAWAADPYGTGGGGAPARRNLSLLGVS